MPKSSEYEFVIPKKVGKYINKQDKNTKELIFNCLGDIEKDPYNSDLMKSHYKGARKKRKGDYRIIFIINTDTYEIQIIKIGKRTSIYR